MNDLQKLSTSFRPVLNHFLNKDFKSENDLTGYFETILAHNLAAVQAVLSQEISKDADNAVEIALPLWDAQQVSREPDAEYLRPVSEMQRLIQDKASEDLAGFYLHGSLATRDYIKGWSDVDTLAIVSTSALKDPQRLLSLRGVFQDLRALMREFDPIQHHGVMIAGEPDLDCFPEALLPSSVLQRMVCLQGNNLLFLTMHPVPPGFDHLKKVLDFIVASEAKGVFEHHAWHDEYLLSEYRNEDNGMYQLKYYLGQFLLFPCLYLTATGRSVYKKDSFDAVRDEFPQVTMDLIDRVSGLRTLWGEKEGFGYSPNRIPCWVKEIFPKDYFKQGAQAAHSLLKMIYARP